MTALPELAERKRSLRRETRASLHAFLRPELKSSWDQQISGFLEQVLPAGGGLAAAFVSLPDEPSLHQHLFTLKSWTWCWPRVEPEGLKFYTVKSPADFVAGQIGLQEPNLEGATAVRIQDCELVCVPGMAFDRRGSRLGRGKGYYDQALAGYAGQKVGVAYSVQVQNNDLPTEPHDVRMNYVVTEKFILKLKGQ